MGSMYANVFFMFQNVFSSVFLSLPQLDQASFNIDQYILSMILLTTLLVIALSQDYCVIPTSSNSTIITLGDCNDLIYPMQMQIGTPKVGSSPQLFGFQIDTGSNVMWVPSITLNPDGFDASLSTTFQNSSVPGSISYADSSSIKGFYGSDIIQVPGTAITVKSDLIVANQMTQGYGGPYPLGVQGLIGMGYTKIPNFLDLAFSVGKISSAVFTLQIRAAPNISCMYYNIIPDSILSKSFFISVPSDASYWQAEILSLTTDGGDDLTSSAPNTAIFDSGTSLIYFNEKLFYIVRSTYFSNCYFLNAQQQCDCADTVNWPTFYLAFQGARLAIPPSAYVINKDLYCSYSLSYLSSFDGILLGDTFFQNYLVTFDKVNSKLGFSGPLIELINLIGDGDNDLLQQRIMLGIIVGIIILGIIMLAMKKYQLIQLRKEVLEEKQLEMTMEPSLR